MFLRGEGPMRIVRSLIGRHGAATGLAAIVIGSAALSLLWVFLVPIYQSPDEDAHGGR